MTKITSLADTPVNTSDKSPVFEMATSTVTSLTAAVIAMPFVSLLGFAFLH